MHTDIGILSPDGYLRLKEDPTLWIRRNPDLCESVRHLRLEIRWGGGEKVIGDSIRELTKLTHLSIKGMDITYLPYKISSLRNLQILDLTRCLDKLQELPPNLGDLESLTSLSISSYYSLKALPDSFAKLSKLSKLHISYCKDLEELPANLGELESLTQLTLRCCTSIKSLPDSVAKLRKLTTLDIEALDNLQELPANLGELKSLTHLSIENCRSLKECPSNLNVVDLSLIKCCSIQSLSRGWSNLDHLVLSLCSDRAEQILANLINLRHLQVRNCSWHRSCAKEMPANLDKLPQLSVLDIRESGIKRFPSSIMNLSQLRLLFLPYDFKLQTLPYQLDESLIITVKATHIRKTWKELKEEMEIFTFPNVRVGPSEYLQLTDTEDSGQWSPNSMVRILDLKLMYGNKCRDDIIDKTADLPELTHLYICGGYFSHLPPTFAKLTHLSLCCVFKCDIESIFNSLGRLSTLEYLHLRGKELPAQMDLPVSLRHLTLHLKDDHQYEDEDEDFVPLPDSMTKLSNLKVLHLIGGIQLDILPGNLNPEKLKLQDCDMTNIKSLPEGLKHVEIIYTYRFCECYELGICLNQLVYVETLSITCHYIKFLPSIVGLHHLQELQLKDCFSLKKLPPNLDLMVNLHTINVGGTRIKSLPSSISILRKLQCLILPKCFQIEKLPLELRNRSVFDDTDDKYYEDMGYYDADHETSSETSSEDDANHETSSEDDDNTTNTIAGISKSQQQLSPYQPLNQPNATLVIGDSHGTIESEQLKADNRLLKIQIPCFPSSQLALHPELELPPNFQHDFSSSTGKNLLVSENGQNEDNMLGEGYNFHGKDHNPVSHHSIHCLRNQEVGEVEGEQNLSISAKSLKRKTHKCEPDVKITQNERNVEVEDNACKSKGMEDEDCSIISPLSSSQKKAAGLPVPDIPPDSVFHNYLSCLSPIDSQICIKVASFDASVYLYSAPDPTHRITVGQAWCFFPDRWLSDFVLNVYLYDIQLRLSETSSTRLILPSLFQGVTLGYDKRNPYGCSDCIQEWCLNTMSSYIPRDLKTIEQVFIPILDKNVGHWFLLVFIVQTKVVYILDSLGTTPERRNLSISVMRNAKLQLRRNKLYQLFKDSLDFTFEEVEAKKQPNCHDCGMYVLKYIECDTIDEMKNTFYSTEDMCVERLKSLAKLVASKHNNNEYRTTFMDVTNVAKHWREMPKNIRVYEEVSKESEEAIIAEQQQTSPQELLNLPADALSDSNYNGSRSQYMDILSRGTLGEMITESSSSFQESFSFGRKHAVQNGQVDITNSDTGHEIKFLKQGNSSCNQKDVSHIENNLDALQNRQIEVNSESEDKKGKRKRNEITREEIQSQFGKKQKDAAIELGVKLSTMKRRCRELGIKAWPSSRMSRRNKRKASTKSPSKSEYSQHVVECLNGVNQHVLSNHVPDHVPSGHNVLDNSTLVATQQHRNSDQCVQQHLDGTSTNLGTSSTIVQPNECSRTIVVKATYKDDQVKVYFPLDSSVELLKEKIGKKLKLEVDKFKMKYQDEDQDLLLVADISDLEDALRVSESSGSNVVRLCIDEA